MPTLEILGSSSSGNAYILTTSDGCLLIECGLPYRQIMQAVGQRVRDINCIVSHGHKDHCLSVPYLVRAGINVYGNVTLGDMYKGILVMGVKSTAQIGPFRVMPLKAYHNIECYSFIIDHPETGRIAFITDTNDWPYKISGVNHWLIECNYDPYIVAERQDAGEDVFCTNEYHMTIDKTIEVLKRNRSADVNSVELIHLSDRFSDENAFIQRVKDEVGVPCVALNKGMTIDLNKDDF